MGLTACRKAAYAGAHDIAAAPQGVRLDGAANMGPLERGREAYARADWLEAFRCLEEADHEIGLGCEDLWRLGLAAHLLGRRARFTEALERACTSHQHDGAYADAAWCAFWIGFDLVDHGEEARGSGWLARAERFVERAAGRCVTAGWLLLPQAQMRLDAGAYDDAFALAERAAALAEELGNADLHVFALHAQGLARLRQGRVTEGLGLLDESMLAVSEQTLLPLVTGIVYCSVISACREVYALHRAHAWTAELSDWCQGQPGVVPFAGTCLVHRAEILQFSGAWTDAHEEARLAEALCRETGHAGDVGAARYVQAETLRVRGRNEEAQAAFEEAARAGVDPQPGLALLRSSQGKHGAAVAALRRALEEADGPTLRARLLPAAIEVRLAAGDVDAAETALAELEAIASAHPAGVLGTITAHARGAVRLARGDAATALASLRAAWRGWQALEAPYEAARTRELVGRACAALNDAETAAIEREAAREAYRRLGAAPDLARIERAGRPAHGLTARETEVLRLVAAGLTNKRIAGRLDLSVRTVERHLANVFAKLEVASRSEATAFAHEQNLV